VHAEEEEEEEEGPRRMPPRRKICPTKINIARREEKMPLSLFSPRREIKVMKQMARNRPDMREGASKQASFLPFQGGKMEANADKWAKASILSAKSGPLPCLLLPGLPYSEKSHPSFPLGDISIPPFPRAITFYGDNLSSALLRSALLRELFSHAAGP